MIAMVRRIALSLVASCLVWAASAAVAPAFADLPKRIALVVGNGAYKNVPALANSVYDARAVAQSLRDLGFQVTDGYDLDSAALRGLVASFIENLPDSSAALVYYAGHGVSVDEENYLLPTDIVLRNPGDLKFNALSVSSILEELKREERANVVILDACRNNPFAAPLKKSKTRSLVEERGLAPINDNLARGAMIAFASDPKSAALDGKEGEHSPFTKALLSHLKDPGVPIDTVMTRVRSEVWANTNNVQRPWVTTSLIGEFRLNEAPVPADTPIVVAGPTPAATGTAVAALTTEGAGEARKFEIELWESAQKSNLSADYQAYLDAFPNGSFAKMAHNRIASLGDSNRALPTAGPSPQPTPTVLPSPSAEALQKEIGTDDTEKSLKLDGPAVMEIYKRLAILKFNVGAPSWTFGEPARAALRSWEKSHAVATTGFLGPLQLAALKAETEAEYAAQPQPQPQIQQPVYAHPSQQRYRSAPYERRYSGGGSTHHHHYYNNFDGGRAAGAFFGNLFFGHGF